MRLPVAEVPTIWLDRTAGRSNFYLRKWIPEYLRWYAYAFGPAMSSSDVQRRSRTLKVAHDDLRELTIGRNRP
jgi:hypothetical protein